MLCKKNNAVQDAIGGGPIRPLSIVDEIIGNEDLSFLISSVRIIFVPSLITFSHFHSTHHNTQSFLLVLMSSQS